MSKGRTKAQALGELLSFLGLEEVPFSIDGVKGLNTQDIERALKKLRYWEGQEHSRVSQRPVKMTHPSEAYTGYRRNVARFVREHTGLRLPVSSLNTARIYNVIADYVDQRLSSS